MKINLILLASGNSKRFNGNKLLTDFKGSLLYMHTLDKIKKLHSNIIKFNKVIVVTQYEDIKSSALDLGFDVILNKESDLGISNSIKLGINRDLNAEGYMFMVCDQPFIKIDTIKKLIYEFEKGEKGICSVGFNNRLGNPNIFSRIYIDELSSLKGDVGGKAVLKKHLDDLMIVQVSDKLELKDIDTIEDVINIENDNI